MCVLKCTTCHRIAGGRSILCLNLMGVATKSSLARRLAANFTRTRKLAGGRRISLLSNLLLDRDRRTRRRCMCTSRVGLLNTIDTRQLSIILVSRCTQSQLLTSSCFLSLQALSTSFRTLSNLGTNKAILSVSSAPFIERTNFSNEICLKIIRGTPRPRHTTTCVRCLFRQ